MGVSPDNRKSHKRRSLRRLNPSVSSTPSTTSDFSLLRSASIQTNKMASVQCTFAVLILAVLIALFSDIASAYPAYGEYYNQQPYYNPYGAISGNYGGSSWDASVVNHLIF